MFGSLRLLLLPSMLAFGFLAASCQGQDLKFRARVNYDPNQIQIMGCDVSFDGTYLVTGGDSIRVFHAPSGRQLHQLRPNRRP